MTSAPVHLRRAAQAIERAKREDRTPPNVKLRLVEIRRDLNVLADRMDGFETRTQEVIEGP